MDSPYLTVSRAWNTKNNRPVILTELKTKAANINPRGGKPGKEKETLTDTQIAALLDTIKDLTPYVFVMIGLYAGLRREEILGLQGTKNLPLHQRRKGRPYHIAEKRQNMQYLAGHENSKVTMDIYAKVKYNKPWELAAAVNKAFEPAGK